MFFWGGLCCSGTARQALLQGGWCVSGHGGQFPAFGAVNQFFKVLDVGQQRAEEYGLRPVLDLQGGEVFDVVIAQQVFVVFDVEPHKTMFRVPARQFGKRRSILFAGIAPVGAKTRDHKALQGLQAFKKPGAVIRWVENIHYKKKSGCLIYDTRVCTFQVFQ